MGLWQDIKKAYKQGAEEQQQIFNTRREKAETLMHLTDTLESLTGSRDINSPLRMAIRFMAVGIDPEDHETIGKIAEAYAMGKFNVKAIEEISDDSLQDSLDKINQTEGKTS